MASRFASRPFKSAVSGARFGKRNFATPAAAAPPLQEKDCRSITPPYEKLLATLQDVRKVLPQGTKLTLAEKILYSHLRSAEDLSGARNLSDIRGKSYLKLSPDRVAMQVSSVTPVRLRRLLILEDIISGRLGCICTNGAAAIHVVRLAVLCRSRFYPL